MDSEKHVEIEKMFLVEDSFWLSLPKNCLYEHIQQGYLSKDEERVVRVRYSQVMQVEQAVGLGIGLITIKGKRVGITCPEFNYKIPGDEAKLQIETLCIQPVLEKRRYFLTVGGFMWSVDYFLTGAHKGTLKAEIELPSEDTPFEKPEWLGREVSHDPSYYNSNM